MEHFREELIPQEGKNILVRPLAAADPIPELTALLHLSYKRLADMGLRFLATHQDDSVTESRARKGLCLIGLEAERIIATITYDKPGTVAGSPWYEQDSVAHFGQFAVHPDYQGKGLGGKLLEIIESLSSASGVRELALDTSERALHLIDYYTKRGYRFIEHVQWDGVNYRSVLLSKTLSAATVDFSVRELCSEGKIPDTP